MAAGGTRIGTGYVSVVPDFSGFQEKVAAKLNSTLAPAMDRAGANASKRLSKSLGNNTSLRSSLQPLLKRFQKFGDNAGEEIASHIGRGSKRASGDMFGLSGAIKEMEKRSSSASSRAKIFANDTFGIAHAARDAGQSYKLLRNATRDWSHDAKTADSVGKRLSKGITSLFSDLGHVGRNLKAAAGGFGNFEGIMARANRGFQFFRNILGSLKIPALVAGVALLAQSLSALAAGAVATASALAPLSGALIALPAAALAGAQAVGVLKLALSGIGAAVKAGLTAQIKGGEQATQTLRTQENAAEALADAHRTLSSSERAAKYAQEDLNKARKEATRQLEDMRIASEESGLTEREGTLALREARKELNKTLREPGATGLDIQAAEQAVEQAKFGLEETRADAKRARADYAEAQKKGVERMPEVVSAKRAVADANRSVADAERGVAKAVRENTDAMKQQGSAATALQQKMAALTPTGRKFAKFLISLKPQFDSLRETAAQGLFPGAEKGLKSALGNLSVVKRVVRETSGALGKLAAKAGAKLGSKAWGRDLGKVGAMNTRILTRMGDAGLNVADAFRNILVSAEPLIEWMSKGTVKLSEWLKTSSRAGRETGSLGHFFDETREAMEKVWRILKPVGEGLLNIGHAARPLGNEILDSLGEAAEGWAKWTGSIEGQNKLKKYFTEVKPAIYAIGRLVRDATNDFAELGRQKGVATLVESIRKTLLPLLTKGSGVLTGFVSDFLNQFNHLRKEGVPAFDAFVQTLAEHAGEASVRIAGALVRGFLNASVWGKLAIAGWLLGKFGGLRAAAGVGARLGGRLGKALFASAAEWIAGTETGASLLGWFQDTMGKGGRFGTAARTAGTQVGEVFGRSLGLGVIAGLVLIAPTIRDAVAKYISDPIQNAIGDTLGSKVGAIFSKGFELIDPANLGPVPTALGIDAKGFIKGKIEDITGLVTGADKAEARMRKFSDSVGKEGGRAREGFRRALDALPDIAERSGRGINRQMLPRLEELVDQGGKKSQAFARQVSGPFGDLNTNVGSAIKSIIANTRQALDKLGVKNALKQFAIKHPNFVYSTGSNLARQQGGPVPKRATGGLAGIVPGHSTGDRHTLSLNGVPVAKVESREGIFVGNRKMMAAAKQANDAVPRFQDGGFVGSVQQLKRGGLVEPKLEGQAGSLKQLGHAAIHKVFEGAKDYLAKHRPMAGALGGITGSGPVESVFAKVAKKLSRSRIATLALGEAGFAESGMRDLGYGDATSEGALQLLASTAASMGIDPHDEGAIASAFLLKGFTGKGGANKLAALGLPAQLVAQGVQGSAFSDGSNYLAQEGAAKGWMRRFGLQSGGLLKLASGGSASISTWRGVGASGLQSGIRNLAAYVMEKFPSLQVTSTTGGTHAADSYHYKGQAADLAGGNMDAAAGWIKSSGLYKTLVEGIHNPNLSVDAGQLVSPSFWGSETWADHADHIHLAVDHPWTASSVAGTESGTASKGGAEKSAEAIPTTYKGAKTGHISFGPMPGTLKAVNDDVKKWERQLPIYRKARRAAEKQGKPATAKALNDNLTAITSRLNGLRQRRTALRFKEVKKHLSKRLSKAFSKLGGYQRTIEGAQQGYEGASQFAEQVVDLEPQAPELIQGSGETDKAFERRQAAAEKAYVADYSGYIEGTERPAYATVLSRVADWRNKILGAEVFGFGKGNPSVTAMQTAWEKQVREADGGIHQIRAFAKAVTQRKEEWTHKWQDEKGHKGKHPKKNDLPKWLKDQLKERRELLHDKLPILTLKDTKLRHAIQKAREQFFPGGENRLAPNSKGIPAAMLPGSGTLEEQLVDVQGIHPYPEQHSRLGVGDLAPPRQAGRFGGVVWDVQTSIEELGLKIRQALNGIATGSGEAGGEEDSERTSLLEQLLREANQRSAVGAAQLGALQGWDSMRAGLAENLPKFHTGGKITGTSIGPREVPILAEIGESVLTADEMDQLEALGRAGGAAGPPTIEHLEIHQDGRVTMRYEGQDFEAAVERVTRRTRGVGVRTPGGARR